ncbi:hypothetical protein, partial [Suttonella ornithocola]
MAYVNLRRLCIAFFLISSLTINCYADISLAGVDLRGTSPGALRKNLDGLKRDTEIAMRAMTSAGPVSASAVIGETWGKRALGNAAKTALKLGKSNLATLLGSLALSYALEKSGWFDDDGVLSYYPDDYIVMPIKDMWSDNPNGTGKKYPTLQDFIADIDSCKQDYYKPCAVTRIEDKQNPVRAIVQGGVEPNTSNYRGSWIAYQLFKCPSQATLTTAGCVVKNEPKPVTDSDIDALDWSGYNPDPSEFPFLKPYLEPPQLIIIKQPEPIKLPSKITTTQNPDGSTTATQTDTIVNITINNNNNNLSTTITETTTTTTYQNGEKIDQKTETTTTDHSNATPNVDSEPKEMPLDCELVPTLCDTQLQIIKQDKDFYDWIKEPFNEELPEFKGVEERKGIEQKRTVDFGSASCPTPIEINTI